MNKKILPVGDVLVGAEIAETPFNCDLEKCKGACCTLESQFGAPLKENEINEIGEIIDKVKSYLPHRHREEIEKNGFYEKRGNELLTRILKNKACVFVYYENDIAGCSVEKAYLDGKINFRKPISCHLFPIRISNFGGDVLRFEKFDECIPAIEKGKDQNTTVADFCKESLNRLYGINWYSQLKEAIGR